MTATRSGGPPGAGHGTAGGEDLAALDPQAASALAARLETTAFEDRAEELGDVEGAARMIEPAARFARVYLQTTGCSTRGVARADGRRAPRTTGPGP